MISFGGISGDKLLCVATNDDLTNMYKILLIYFIDAGTDVYPDYSNKCTQYWLGDLGKYVIKGVDSDPTNDKIIYTKHFIKKENDFLLIKCPIESMALAWLMHLYH